VLSVISVIWARLNVYCVRIQNYFKCHTVTFVTKVFFLFIALPFTEMFECSPSIPQISVYSNKIILKSVMFEAEEWH